MLCLLCCCTAIFAQQDKHGNPVFNSVVLKEIKLNGLLLHCNYYTLKHNLENPQSSVFIADTPTLAQIADAAVRLPSDFFILTKESRVVALITLLPPPQRSFMVIDMKTGEQSLFPCALTGDMTQNRAAEIMREQYDPAARLVNGQLFFNGQVYSVLKSADIEKAAQDLIMKEKLNERPPSDRILPSQEALKQMVLQESQPGGRMDFFTEIKGIEKDGVQIKPGVFSTNMSVALYRWGRACFEVGVNTLEDAQAIYAAWQQRALTEREKDYIRMGFFKEWER